jgi:hypothetical protein
VAKLIALAAAVLVLTAIVFVATRPDRFRVERSAQIHAPREVVFAFVQDFRKWADWSPYEKLDADLKRTYAGAPRGVGATYSWEGKKAGVGKMTILEAKPGELVTLRLEFVKPIAATNRTIFTFAPSADGTHVTWVMDGENTWMGKVMSAFFDMDKFVGGDFEKGLAELDKVASAASKNAPPAFDGAQARGAEDMTPATE